MKLGEVARPSEMVFRQTVFPSDFFVGTGPFSGEIQVNFR